MSMYMALKVSSSRWSVIVGMQTHLEKYSFCIPYIQNHKDLTYNKGPLMT